MQQHVFELRYFIDPRYISISIFTIIYKSIYVHQSK